jgi:hypothetical protein
MLIVPGLLLRAAVPPGFMPAVSHGTTVTMEVCPGHATLPNPSLGASGPAGSPPDHGKSGHHTAPCVFAAAAGAAPLPSVAAFAALADTFLTPIPTRYEAPTWRIDLRAHSPRAPPAHA